jgi:hypothetical protein
VRVNSNSSGRLSSVVAPAGLGPVDRPRTLSVDEPNNGTFQPVRSSVNPVPQDSGHASPPSRSEAPLSLPLDSLEALMIAAIRFEANRRRQRVEGHLESRETAALLLATFGRGMAVSAAVLRFAPALQRELDTLVLGIDRRFENDRATPETTTDITAPSVAHVGVQARRDEAEFCIGGVPVERRARERTLG